MEACSTRAGRAEAGGGLHVIIKMELERGHACADRSSHAEGFELIRAILYAVPPIKAVLVFMPLNVPLASKQSKKSSG